MKTKIPSEHISKTSLIYQRYKINSPDSEIIFRNWTASRVSYWRKLHINRERHCKCFKDQTTIHLFKQKLKRCCFNYGVTLNKFRLAFKKHFPWNQILTIGLIFLEQITNRIVITIIIFDEIFLKKKNT